MSRISQKIDFTLSFKVKLNLTARDWQLYSSRPGADRIASLINRALETILNEGADDWDQLMWRGYEVLAHPPFVRYGASDTEPRDVWLDILDELGRPN